MTEPVYSRPSDDTPTPDKEDGGKVTAGHVRRNRKSRERRKRKLRELREENERLHRRLAAIYDALSL